GRVEQDRSDDPFGITSDEEDCTGVRRRNVTSPPVLGAIERERREKTHGRSRLDRVDQKLSESTEIGVTHRQNQSLDRVCLLGHGWQTPPLSCCARRRPPCRRGPPARCQLQPVVSRSNPRHFARTYLWQSLPNLRHDGTNINKVITRHHHREY